MIEQLTARDLLAFKVGAYAATLDGIEQLLAEDLTAEQLRELIRSRIETSRRVVARQLVLAE